MDSSAPSRVDRRRDGLRTVVGDYLAHLAVERGVAANTLAAYGRDLRRYADCLTIYLACLADQLGSHHEWAESTESPR